MKCVIFPESLWFECRFLVVDMKNIHADKYWVLFATEIFLSKMILIDYVRKLFKKKKCNNYDRDRRDRKCWNLLRDEKKKKRKGDTPEL